MSLVDTLKGLVGKGKEAASKNADKINEAVDKAGNFIDDKTKGKYSDKIEKGKEAAKKVVPPERPGQPGSQA
ncbi:antitoxin [Nocardia sp. GCM10030253]|uniref:antitoxin n=1 Tax=Nocardia sp. GCM10030253 TaxID=3273404 RepID=UPI00363C0B95